MEHWKTDAHRVPRHADKWSEFRTNLHRISEYGYIYVHRDNDSLSQIKHSYKDSKIILDITYSKLNELLEYFDISESYKLELYEAVSKNLYKTIYSLYRPQFKIGRKKREVLLSSVIEEYKQLLFLDKQHLITRNILRTNNILLIDLYYTILFYARYNFSWLYNSYRIEKTN